MKVIQYALSFLDNEGNRRFTLSNCEVVELSGQCLFSTKRTAERSLKRLNEILKPRTNNLKLGTKKEPKKWEELYKLNKQMLDNGVEVVEIELSVNQ